MDEKYLQKRISETKTEIFPLDRFLPLESVYLIFQQEYSKSQDRNLFFRERKFQRLREGYFAIFVAASLQDISGKKHGLVFPEDAANDVYIVYKMHDEPSVTEMGCHEFDIKEFTNWSPSFSKFLEKKIIPKLDIYNIAIPTYRDLDGKDIEPLVDYMQLNNLNTKVWFLGVPTKDEDNPDISYVTIISKEGLIYEKTIDLKQYLDKDKPIIIYQDILRFK